MKIILTGGSGDLGQLVSSQLVAKEHTPLVLDIRPPIVPTTYINASITDINALKSAFNGSDAVIHIAAWHGIHEFRNEKSIYEFWDVNVTGAFNVFQAAAEANVKNMIFISSSSISHPYSVYGHTKVLGEEIARAYAYRHEMNVIALRPRAFIPSWNRNVYNSYV